MDLADIQKTSYKIAMDHGFWSTEEDRNVPSKLALIHSEVSEALGEYRHGRMELYYHYTGPKEGHDGILESLESDEGRVYLVETDHISRTLMTHEKYIELGYEAKPEGFGIELADTIIRIADLAGHLGIDLEKLIRLKWEYNVDRPFKHGRRV